jgi:ubiquinone biosynthesis protein
MRNPFFRIRRTYTHLVRYRHIMGVLMKYGFEEAAGIFARRLKIGLGSSLPQRARLAAEELGPTFVKLGQMLSTRPDLIPVDYVSELEHLQDRVAPEKYKAIRNTVKQQLGAFPEEIFETFEPVPLAAASIAQVHRARTKEGREVVVKIRRPGIVKTIRTEMEMLLDIAALVKMRLGRNSTIDPVRMVNEFSQARRSILPMSAATSSVSSITSHLTRRSMCRRYLRRIHRRVSSRWSLSMGSNRAISINWKTPDWSQRPLLRAVRISCSSRCLIMGSSTPIRIRGTF